MKTFKIIVGLLLISISAFAQNYNNYSTPYSGVNRNIGRSYSPPQQPSSTEVEKKKTEQLDKFMDNLKKELVLDDLQTIAIRNEIAKNNKNIDIIVKKEISDDEKSKEITAMMEKTDIIVKSYLNKEQKEKYKILVEDNKSKKKDKKKKKDDKPIEE